MPHEPLRVGGAEVVPLCDARVPLVLDDELPVDLEEGWQPYRAAYPWAFLGETAWDFHIHALLVRLPGSTVLIDVGIGSGAPADYWGEVRGALVTELAIAGASPPEIDHVVFTHLHVDHIGGAVTEEGEPMFPFATYHAHLADWEDFVEAEDPDDRDAFERAIRPVADRDRLVVTSQDHEIVPGVHVMHAPGHTRGHRAIRIESAGVELLVTGDALHHPVQVTHPEWPSTHDLDPSTGIETRRELLDLGIDGDLWMCVPHFAEPFGRVSAGEPAARWLGSVG